MGEVEIEYCVPCGLLDEAQDAQQAILEEFGQDIEAVRLKTGDGGVFKIRVNGEEIYDKNDEGYKEGEIIERVRQRL
ncbi:MAG: Rdx family protein [Halobacteria archaeon]|nr:Rdx family protein [Halobacteria archaeon]